MTEVGGEVNIDEGRSKHDGVVKSPICGVFLFIP